MVTNRRLNFKVKYDNNCNHLHSSGLFREWNNQIFLHHPSQQIWKNSQVFCKQGWTKTNVDYWVDKTNIDHISGNKSPRFDEDDSNLITNSSYGTEKKVSNNRFKFENHRNIATNSSYDTEKKVSNNQFKFESHRNIAIILFKPGCRES